MRQIVKLSLALLLLAGLVGCGSRHRSGTVSGTLTYRGKPVSDAALLLYPSDGSRGDPLTIPVDHDGEFSILDLPPGEYTIAVQGAEGQPKEVTLSSFPPEKRAEIKAKLDEMVYPSTPPFPKKYKNPRTSDFQCTITGQNQTLDLEMKD